MVRPVTVALMRIGGARLGLVLGTLGLATALSLPAWAAGGSSLEVKATVGGHSLKDAGANSPIELRPSDSTVVSVSVTNNGSSAVEVRSIRLDARVLGLAFFSYTTRVDLTVDPGATGTRTFALDLGDLDGQATGLLPAELALLGPDRSVIMSETGTVDVKGKIKSVYGVFGLAVAAITALLLASLLFRLVRRTLPENRWSRAVRFAVPGVGLGLVVTFTLGVLRVAVPSKGLSIGMLVGGLLVGFVLGYLTPAPGDEADRDELDERDVVAVPPIPTAPVVPPAPAVPIVPASRPTAAPFAAPAPSLPPPPVRPTPPEGDARETRVVGPPPTDQPPSP